MANKRVRLVRNVKLNGRPTFVAPDITPKGVISAEMVRYKGQRIKVPATAGNWYIRWEEGNQPKWQRADSMSDAISLRVRKQIELQASAAGIEIKPEDPARLRLADAFKQYIDDQKLLKRSKKTLAAHRVTKETFLKSCHRAYLDQVDRRDLLRYADSLRKDGLSERTVFTRWIAVMTILKFHGIRGLTKPGDTPKYTEPEPEAYSQEELEQFFKACKPNYHLLFQFYLKTGFRMQEVMYLQWSDLNFGHRTVSVTEKPERGFIPKRWHTVWSWPAAVPIPDAAMQDTVPDHGQDRRRVRKRRSNVLDLGTQRSLRSRIPRT
jgi:integrase